MDNEKIQELHELNDLNLYQESDKQDKHFAIITYEKIKEETLIALGVKKYAMVNHNRDLNEANEPLKAHWHTYIYLSKKSLSKSLFKIIDKMQPGITNPFLVKKVGNVNLYIRYLIHIDNPDKFQYDLKDIETNFELEPYFSIGGNNRNHIFDIIEMIANGEISTIRECYYIAHKYGVESEIMKRCYFFKTIIDESTKL